MFIGFFCDFDNRGQITGEEIDLRAFPFSCFRILVAFLNLDGELFDFPAIFFRFTAPDGSGDSADTVRLGRIVDFGLGHGKFSLKKD